MNILRAILNAAKYLQNNNLDIFKPNYYLKINYRFILFLHNFRLLKLLFGTQIETTYKYMQMRRNAFDNSRT